MTGRKRECWVIPPAADAAFAAGMEAVRDVYTRPYDSKVPVLCTDEQAVPLLNETRQPIPATATHPRRVDYEYERAGGASLFLFCEPPAGWRPVTVRPHRTKIDWAGEVADVLRGRYANVAKVILVSDNVNAHTPGAFYPAFDPAMARSRVKRLEFSHTLKHGRWLNMAENELRALPRSCVRGPRFGTIAALREETVA